MVRSQQYYLCGDEGLGLTLGNACIFTARRRCRWAYGCAYYRTFISRLYGRTFFALLSPLKPSSRDAEAARPTARQMRWDAVAITGLRCGLVCLCPAVSFDGSTASFFNNDMMANVSYSLPVPLWLPFFASGSTDRLISSVCRQ